MELTQHTYLTLGAIILLLSGSTHAGKSSKSVLKDHEVKTLYNKEKHVAAQAQAISFAKHFQNHMVLQKEPARANIYGFSPNIGQVVNAELVTPAKRYTYSTTVHKSAIGNTGEWTIELDAQNADTPANITVTSQGTTLNLTDVVFGDVWLCSGQSNMQFAVTWMIDADAERADTNYPKIRLMSAADKESTTPLNDLIELQIPWTTPNPTNIDWFSAVCWVYGKNIHKALGYPIGLVHTSWGGTPAEAWSSPEALKKCGNLRKKSVKNGHSSLSHENHVSAEETRLQNPTDNSVLWNAMIYPFLKMSIKGAIWYQGEGDAGGVKQDHYNCTFPTMISDWRQNFNKASNGQTDPVFPFGFVQLAPYDNRPTVEWGFPDIRWHQTADLGYAPNPVMPKTFMAVAMDLPDFNSTQGSIHPRYKKEIGDRLSLGGLAVAYGRPEVYQGPYPTKGEVTSSGFKITYGSSSTLEIRNTTGFELQCNNRWVASSITAHDKVSITLKSVCSTGERVTGVRYAWRESPCSFKMCAVYEQVNGLPGPPFILTVATDTNGRSYIDFDRPVSV